MKRHLRKQEERARRPSQRQLRAGELIRHALVDILREEELADPALQGVSVHGVGGADEPRPQARHLLRRAPGGRRRRSSARSAVAVVDIKEVIAGLNRGAKFLRGRLGKLIDMKFTPDLKFLHDESFNSAAYMDRLFDDPRVQQDVRRLSDVADEDDQMGTRLGMARRKKGDAVSGWICLDKPYDLTSTSAVSRVRRAFNAQKAGHAGTLDPLATGILPLALGEATKTVPFLMDADKAYRFMIQWGRSTTTLDREGETTDSSDVRPTREAVEAALPSFIGEIDQIPPNYSAIKVDGERAYDLAREGVEFELKTRKVNIHALRVTRGGRTPTTSSWRWNAARAPMSAPSSATWPRRSAPAATSTSCAARESAGSPRSGDRRWKLLRI
jgi:tRNA pseudouridine(55) synthase